MKFVFVSTNKNKYNELAHIFPYKLEFYNLELLEIQGTLHEISLHKARTAFDAIKDKFTNYMVITDDVSFEITALNNFPGPYIKHFLNIGYANVKLVVDSIDDKRASTHCALGICYLNKSNLVTEVIVGSNTGNMIFDRIANNKNAFGFDYFFVPEPFSQTYAEMEFKEKNAISHRGNA
ncbi:nucleoside triphosphate pyrophosphohydrolase ham1, partial [Conglomerata obtusa]